MFGIDTFAFARAFTRYGTKLTWLLAGVCLVLVVLSCAWHVRNTIVAKERDYAPQQRQTIVASTGPNYQMSNVVRANLFGNPTPQPVAKQAPKTTLDLTLQGVLWASENTLARAIIQSGRGSSKLYSIGERIAGAGASVKEIRDNEVILDRNGASESLPLVKLNGGDDIITFTNGQSNGLSQASFNRPNRVPSNQSFRSSGSASDIREGQGRKVRKPNFSGLDRALEKLGDI